MQAPLGSLKAAALKESGYGKNRQNSGDDIKTKFLWNFLSETSVWEKVSRYKTGYIESGGKNHV